jgi:hypothetical protein
MRGVGSTFSRTYTFGVPARNRSERRGVQRLPGAQAEAGVVPRAAHRVADHQPFRQRTVVVRARRAGCEELVPATREQDRVIADVAGEHRTVSKCVDRDTLGQIGAGRFGLRSAHVDLLTRRF